MKVWLYSGALKLVEKSGVGQALHHQEAMLQSAGVCTTRRRDHSASIVHINTVFPDSVLAALFARFRRQKVICYGHSTMEDFRNSFKLSNTLAPLFKRWITLCYSLGDAVITPSEYSRSLLLQYGIEKPVYVLSNGVDTALFRANPVRRAAFRAQYHLSENDRAVISVGHYILRKGLLDYIALARAMPDVRFLWFGYTNPKLIPAEIQQALKNAPPNLTFPGYVDQEALCDAYCGCDLFCFMSYEETEGIVVLEALSCEIPVLLRDIPVYDGWLEHGFNVYKCRDFDSFLQNATKILSGLAPDLTRAGRKTAEERDISKAGSALLAIYQNLLNDVLLPQNAPAQIPR